MLCVENHVQGLSQAVDITITRQHCTNTPQTVIDPLLLSSDLAQTPTLTRVKLFRFIMQ